MAIQVLLDGQDVSEVAITGSVTRRLNRPAQATITIPMDSAIGGAGSILKISFEGTLFFHGFVLDCEVDTAEDFGQVVYNAQDPMELWNWRPVRDDDGDFSRPDIIATYQTGPQIIEAMLNNSIDTTPGGGGPPPSDAEGPIFLTLGTFEVAGADISGAPVDWPMTMAQLTSLLVSTGEVDVVITPTDPGGGVMGTVDAYNGDYGTDRTATVQFAYGTGRKNVRRLRWNEDMTSLCNKLWYYGGPRIQTASDPSGDQHWCWNITADDPLLPDPPLSQILAARVISQATYGVRMDIKIWDALSNLCLGQGGVDPERWLYRYLWLVEAWVRQAPRDIVHVTPVRLSFNDQLPPDVDPVPLGAFDIGDLVVVEAAPVVRGGFTGVQRVYEYTVAWDQDVPYQISELQTSPNNEGLA